MELAAHWRSRRWVFSSQVVYCVFAIVGMELFHGKIQFFPANSNAPHALECGNPALKDSLFARGKYCKNNFNNFASSFIVLMELTVVNQWHDILCGARSELELGHPCSSPTLLFPLYCTRPCAQCQPTEKWSLRRALFGRSLLGGIIWFPPLALIYSRMFSSFSTLALNSPLYSLPMDLPT